MLSDRLQFDIICFWVISREQEEKNVEKEKKKKMLGTIYHEDTCICNPFLTEHCMVLLGLTLYKRLIPSLDEKNTGETKTIRVKLTLDVSLKGCETLTEKVNSLSPAFPSSPTMFLSMAVFRLRCCTMDIF